VANDPAARFIGSQIGPYQVTGLLGRGGMGVVLHAIQPHLGREVALKLMMEGALATPESRERFLNEARVMARLQHPGLLHIHDAGEHEGLLYYAMDLVRGTSLEQVLEQLEPAQLAGILGRVAQTLHYVHDHGLIHRDVKPSNVLLDPTGRPLLMDFGLVKDTGSGRDLTATGALLGTPAFMAPEQAGDDPHLTDHRCDIYALGAMLYTGLAGRRPYVGTPINMLTKLVMGPPPPLSQVASRPVPPELEAIAARAMARDPGERYSTAEELGRALLAYAGEPSELNLWNSMDMSGERGQAPYVPELGSTATLRPPAPASVQTAGPDDPTHAQSTNPLLARAALPPASPAAASAAGAPWPAIVGTSLLLVAIGVGLAWALGSGAAAEHSPGSAAANAGPAAAEPAKTAPAKTEPAKTELAKTGAPDDPAVDVAPPPQDAGGAGRWLGLAREREAEGDTPGALAAWTQAIAIAPEDPRGYAGRAWLQRGSEREAALRDARAASAFAPGDLDLLALQAFLLWKLERRREALEVADAVLVSDPDHGAAWLVRAYAYSHTRRLDEALDASQRAVAGGADPGEAHRQKGYVHFMRGEHEPCRDEFSLALEIDPDHGWSYLMRGTARRGLGDLAGAIQDMRRGVELSPNDEGGWWNLASAYLAQDDVDAAVQALEGAVRANPRLRRAWVLLAELSFRTRDLSRATEACTQAVELRPDDAGTWALRAQVHLLRGHLPPCQADAERALELDPGHTTALAALALSLAHQGQVAEARAVRERLLALDPNHVALGPLEEALR
jgi:serine/threonine protein kinase/Flp pilus assembly protein TadD